MFAGARTVVHKISVILVEEAPNYNQYEDKNEGQYMVFALSVQRMKNVDWYYK